jgi:hypothetical protein
MLSDTPAATRRAHSASASSTCLLHGDDEPLRVGQGINHAAGGTGPNRGGAHPAGDLFGVKPWRAQAFQRSGCANISAGSHHVPSLWHGTGGTSYYCSGAEVSLCARGWRQMLRGHVHGETLQLPRGKKLSAMSPRALALIACGMTQAAQLIIGVELKSHTLAAGGGGCCEATCTV